MISSAMKWLGLGVSATGSAVLPSSPFQTGSLTGVVYLDLFGEDAQLPLTRDDAMSLAPVSRGRNIICGAIASTPLRLFPEDGGEAYGLEVTPRWLNHTSGVLSAYLRMTMTLDDGIMFAESLWQVERDSGGVIVDAWHVPYALWEVDPQGHVIIDGQRVPDASVLYFPFHVEGFLRRGARTLRSALAVERGVEERAANPIPLSVIQSVNDDGDMNQTEAQAYLDAYRTARQKGGGAAVMYLPSFLKLAAYGDRADSGHAIEARNALRLDFANHLGIPASRLEGSQAEASLTYTNQAGQDSSLADATGLGQWMDDIAGRLSQDDVTAPGVVVRFFREQLLTSNPEPAPVQAPVTDQVVSNGA
jgi:hypothetical protein